MPGFRRTFYDWVKTQPDRSYPFTPLLLYECGWYMPDGTGKFGRYSGDIRLAASTDGQRFARVNPHQQVIARGPRGTWDSGRLS